MNSVAKCVAKWFPRTVAVVFVLILGVVAWVVYSLVRDPKLPGPSHIDKVVDTPKVRAARQTAARDVEAAYVTLERTMGGRAAQRAEAVSDVCGIKLRTPSFYEREWWTDVRCEREVVRAYVLDGPRAENATTLAIALEAAGWTRNGPGAVNPGTPPCPAPASSTVGVPVTPVDDEPACAIDAVLPSRVSLRAELWDVGRSAHFPSRLGATVVCSTASTEAHLDVRAITNAPRPPGSSVVIVSVLNPYFRQ